MDETGIKQVIVMRKDLGMRKGKMAAQAAHACMKVFFDRKIKDIPADVKTQFGDTLMIPVTEAMRLWIDNQFTKICVGVNSEQELMDIWKMALSKDLPCSIIQDMGHTEFKEPTFTCLAIGPAKAELIDEVTGTLSLL